MQLFKTFLLPAILFLVIMKNSFAQAPIKNFDKEWMLVDELITQKNLPQTALANVKKIYALAQKEQQDAQIIKSVIYMIGLQQETREENRIHGIKEIEMEIASGKEPVRSIFKSLLAEMYWNYFQNNRWKFYSRSETHLFQKEDIRTWSPGDFHKKISELYLQSIRNEKILQQTKLNAYDAIILKGNMRHLRPTLYDLLAHRALVYFKNEERDISRPAYTFELNQVSAFDPAADFIRSQFFSNDSLSLQLRSLQIYQKLIAFHLHDTVPDALLDADIDRLEFVYAHSTLENKKELYRAALTQLTRQYPGHPAADQAWYLLAKEYDTDARSYTPLGDTTHRLARVKALEICEKVLNQKALPGRPDSSEGKINCYNLANQIKIKSFQFTLEKVNVPGQPFRALVRYRNIGKLHLRLIQSNEKIKEKLTGYLDEKTWTDLVAAPPLSQWQQELPATHDYQTHATEIKIEALQPGEYILLATADSFSKNSVMGARLFAVSAISYISHGNDYFVLNRETGKPLPAASVQVWEQVYDYKNFQYTVEKGNFYTTDSNGFFRLTNRETQNKNRRIQSYKLDIRWNTDRLFMNDWLYDYSYRNHDEKKDEKETIRIFYFTDRSIYRPGQMIFFKGIAIKGNKENRNEVVEHFKTKIYLKNVSNQPIDSLTVTTNEYGSFSGKFQLPVGTLNGQFFIFDEAAAGKTEFSVEEYKRPKFFVTYEKLKGTYKVGDQISLSGFAQAYSGYAVNDATVKYRVIREARFIYPGLFHRGWQPPTSPMEIAHGETQTDNNGKFIVPFEAIPDKSLDKIFDPVFDYRIYADVTDINGETRSGETVISVSYKSLVLKSEVVSSLPADSLKAFSIRTENLAGEFIQAIAKVSIYKLKEETRLIRSRYWARPDQYVMTKDEFLKYFPNDEYAEESNYRSWETGDKIFEREDSVKETSVFTLSNTTLPPGFYKVEILAKDKNGEEVKDIKYLELTDEKSNRLLRPQYLWSESSLSSIEPGENTLVKVGTSADYLFVIQRVNKPRISNNTESQAYDFDSLRNEKKIFSFPATEADRGGYSVSWCFVKQNRFYAVSIPIPVSWRNKDLKIEYASFRDKTLPGSDEKWKLKIIGYKKELVAAEILASLYDASLDQFAPHSWSLPSIWPFYSAPVEWNSSQNFAPIQSQQKWGRYSDQNKILNKRYDFLLGNFSTPLLITEYKRNNQKNFLSEIVMAAPQLRNEEELDKGMEVKNLTETVTVAGVKNKDRAEKEDQFTEQNTATQIRKNFNETAFFMPHLRTDSSGAIEFAFTMPEALTRWKFQALAHTKDLAMGYNSKEIVTQKQLMVQPNIPRFLREGDKMEFSVKIVNLTDKELTGQAELQLFDAGTKESVSGWFRNIFPSQYFTVGAGQSENVQFPLEVPYLFPKALTWRVIARAGDFSDGEEAVLPVLTNRTLVTETLPLDMKNSTARNFRFDKLINQNSETRQHHLLTVEFTSNPAWYAVQALPYLMEYPYECAEQTWNRYYANALATTIANSTPRIKQLFEQWKIQDTTVLVSGLQKNPELKTVLLEETPWVLQAKSEEQQKKNIALLFDLVQMSKEQNNAFEKLKQMQSSNGGFGWFQGAAENVYITQYILTGMGHLKKLGVDIKMLFPILDKAIPYLDRQIKNHYNMLQKQKTGLKTYLPGHYEIQYLYMRSFFPEIKIPASVQAAFTFFRKRSQQTWMKQNKYMQGMIALALYRTADLKTPVAILKSLKETSLTNEELGRYWKETSSATQSGNGGWFWYQAPVETQALLIEAFQEIAKDTITSDEMRTWLLKNKQTNHWKTTKATAEACYAFLLQGTSWLNEEPEVEIKLGNMHLKSTDSKREAGTGYFKKSVDGHLIYQDMGNIQVTLTKSRTDLPRKGLNLNAAPPSWGAVYWQYFENLDKITGAATPLKLDKKLFTETYTDRGPVLTPINEGDVLKVGDKIKVRIELRVDRDMEYVHMKDMRASCLEPVNVLSKYQWQDGLGYYESIRDASTNFFFDYLKKGTYVFEYAVFVTHAGNFSNGITHIQCMYAPDFAAHSEGIRIRVE